MNDPTNNSTSQAWYDGKFFKSCMALLPLFRWLIVLAMFLAGVYVYQRDTNAASVVNIADLQRGQESIKLDILNRAAARDKQLEDVKRQMLTREVFEAYHESDKQRLERIESMIQRLLEHERN